MGSRSLPTADVVRVLLHADASETSAIVRELRLHLVLVGSENADVDLDVLEQIAPVVVAPHDDSGDWREASLVYADAVDRRDEMEQVLADLDERCAELADRLDAASAGPVTAPASTPSSSGCTARSASRGPSWTSWAPAAQDEPIQVSYEQLAGADADTALLHRLSDEDAARQRQVLAANPLRQRLRAVQSGRVVEVDDHWYGTGRGPPSSWWTTSSRRCSAEPSRVPSGSGDESGPTWRSPPA